jgi:hypothetical protein
MKKKSKKRKSEWERRRERERERKKAFFTDIPIHTKNSHQHNNETLLKLHREQLQ